MDAAAALFVALIAAAALTGAHGQDVAPTIPPSNGSNETWVPPINTTEILDTSTKISTPNPASSTPSPATIAPATAPNDASAATATIASTPIVTSAPWNLSIPKTDISPSASGSPYLRGKDAIAYLNGLSSQPGKLAAKTVDTIASSYSFSSTASLLKLLGEDKDFGIVRGSNNLFYACSKGARSNASSITASPRPSNTNTNTTAPRRFLHAHHHHTHDFSQIDSAHLPRATRQLLQLPQVNAADPDPSTFQLTSSGVPILRSRPAATRKIFLDFDGHTATGTAWNAGTTTVPPYDTDYNPSSFSIAERRDIIAIWRAVSEDYAAFDVDVTTVDPGLSGLLKTSDNDVNYGVRACIGGSPRDWFNPGGGQPMPTGIAFIDSFGAAWSGAVDQPCFIWTREYNSGYPANAMQTWETISHEVGHTLGLSHDGQWGNPYYGGHGDWAPIMGLTDFKMLSQWSKGEYAGATNTEDDYVRIAKYLPHVADDHANSAAGATRLTSGLPVSGIMGVNDPADFFSISVGRPSTVTAWVHGMEPWNAPWLTTGYSRSNLDVELRLLNPQGQVVTSSNPGGSPASSLRPGWRDFNVPAAGTYFLSVMKAGQGDASTGYTTYGCVGTYVITALFTASAPAPIPSPPAASVRMTITPNANCVPARPATGMQLLPSATSYVDDASRSFALPFGFRFGGVDYGNNRSRGIWIGSNSYITFGGNATDYNSLGASRPALRTIHVASADVSWERVYVWNYGLLGGHRWYAVRFEGYSSAAKRSAVDVVWMAWFSTRNDVQLCFGPRNANLAAKNPWVGVSDGRNWLAKVDYASVANARVDITGL